MVGLNDEGAQTGAPIDSRGGAVSGSFGNFGTTVGDVKALSASRLAANLRLRTRTDKSACFSRSRVSGEIRCTLPPEEEGGGGGVTFAESPVVAGDA